MLISLSYIFYACFDHHAVAPWADALTQCRLQQIANIRVWMIVVAVILTILSIVDGGIAFAFWYWGAGDRDDGHFVGCGFRRWFDIGLDCGWDASAQAIGQK